MASRFSENNDNTGRLLNFEEFTPAYAATIALTPNASETFVNPAQLTGNAVINLTVTNCKIQDKLVIVLNSDGSARTVTLGTGMAGAAATIVCGADLKATISFIFDGTAFIETARSVGA